MHQLVTSDGAVTVVTVWVSTAGGEGRARSCSEGAQRRQRGSQPHRAAPSLATSCSSSPWGRSSQGPSPRASAFCVVPSLHRPSTALKTARGQDEHGLKQLGLAWLSSSPIWPHRPLGGLGRGHAGELSQHGQQVLRCLPGLPSCPLRQVVDKLPPGGWPAGETPMEEKP